MHCFYIDPPANGAAALPADEAKHAARVLRLRPGDEVCAMDGAGGRWRAEIAGAAGDEVTVRLVEALPSNESPVRVTVYQGVPKADKLDFIAQKLTELGAAALTPVRMSRCVTRLDEKDGRKRRGRLDKIAREAAKQCKRGSSTVVMEPQTWKQLKEKMSGHDLLMVPWEDAKGYGLQAARADFPDAKDIGIIIGPEGGMSAAEIQAIEEIGARQITLGPRILRTETAAVASCAMAMLLWGDIG